MWKWEKMEKLSYEKVEMIFRTKFSIGDRVWTITDSALIVHICNTCSGRGFIVGDDKNEVRCPTCRGQKELWNKSFSHWTMQENAPIQKIVIEQDVKEGLKVWYKVGPIIRKASHVFGSKEEAMKACNELQGS